MQGSSSHRSKSSTLDCYRTSQMTSAPNLLGALSPHSRHSPLGRDGDLRTPEHGAPQIAARSDCTMKTTKTPAERARELSILSDPLANLLSPDYVECKQCKKKIKLSSKSAYDTFHWRNHRKRCVKSFKKKGKQLGPPNANIPSSGSSQTLHLKNTRTYKSSASVLASTRSPKTPPLMSDNDEDHRSELSSEAQSPLMANYSMPSIQSPSSVPYYDYNVQDYLGRSHPGYVPRQPVRHSWCTTSASSQNWSWSQLKPSIFQTVKHSTGDDEDEDDLSIEDQLDTFGDDRVQEAARTLSMLSRSR